MLSLVNNSRDVSFVAPSSTRKAWFVAALWLIPATIALSCSAQHNNAPAPHPVVSSSDTPLASSDTSATPDASSAQPVAIVAASANTVNTPAEHWAAGMTDSGRCTTYKDGEQATPVKAPEPPWQTFSYAGYVEKTLRVSRSIDGVVRHHCVKVTWPPGQKGNDKLVTSTYSRIHAAWFKALENTLQRLPWRHLQVVKRFVIDNRPKEHGIAPFDRENPSTDARDGHTIWLHERLFTDPNHWMHGNFGEYWSYHVQHDGQTIDQQPAEHNLFSPVLIHEIGHLIAYNVVLGGVAKDAVPECAKVCPDRLGKQKKQCLSMPPEEREQGCISAYCMPFNLPQGSENWAEQYRFFYQSETTRHLLESMKGSCFETLAGSSSSAGFNFGRPPPWQDGLPDIVDFRKTRWASCGGKSCKDY